MKDPAFLFYPGDYLRDTQCLSEKSQVAYDRIMCEHMRNICISQSQVNFFTKRLSDEEKSELMFLLTEVSGGFQITWVADSILKRRSYSDSRRKNRTSKTKNISSTYDSHMENENENEIEDIIKKVKGVTEEKETKPKFTYPTLYEVMSYCNERNNSVDPETWFNFYSSKGWMIGKNKMKDWRAAVRTWEKNQTSTPNGTEQKFTGSSNKPKNGLSDSYKQSVLERLQCNVGN